MLNIRNFKSYYTLSKERVVGSRARVGSYPHSFELVSSFSSKISSVTIFNYVGTFGSVVGYEALYYAGSWVLSASKSEFFGVFLPHFRGLKCIV
jgi:hypothetical protein